MSNEIYVVLERNYEYNDESYDMSEGGNCHLAFRTYATAAAKVQDLMIESFRKEHTYMYDRYCIFNNSPEAVAVLTKYGYHTHKKLYYNSEEFFRIISQAPEEDLIVLINDLRSPLYYIETVKVG